MNVPVAITRRHCRAAAAHRRDFNEGNSEVLDWAGNCPLAQLIKEYNDYQSVSVQDKAVQFRDKSSNSVQQFYMAKDLLKVIKETDDFITREGWQASGESCRQFNGNALYAYLQNNNLLEVQLRENV